MTKEQRFARLRAFGCVCCRMTGIHNDQVDMHHLVDKGNRDASGGDRATLPICPYHHRGVLPDGWTSKQAFMVMGPSLAGGRKPFVKHWGTERELLAKVNFYLTA